MDRKTAVLADFIAAKTKRKVEKILVVGCGSGVEAAVLGTVLEAEVVGIDLIDNFTPPPIPQVTLQWGDAMNLAFADESFDFVYSFHALEHIEKPALAIREIFRVLKVGGGLIIGTPNRSRLVGYLGSTCSRREKILWNLADWRKRLLHQFRNELGAHAGFTKHELATLLRGAFSEPEDITDSYFSRIYAEKITKTITSLRLNEMLFPSVYFMCFRHELAPTA